MKRNSSVLSVLNLSDRQIAICWSFAAMLLAADSGYWLVVAPAFIVCFMTFLRDVLEMGSCKSEARD